ncbi:MAG TPA: DUF2079 domain-containing protein [Anaerolineae bacterium]|nr:DUF2079 domain-containing protein [Anaerolineae bacterium]
MRERFVIWLRAEGKYWLVLGACMTAYLVLMTRAQFNKYDSYGMGFDLGVYEQVIWNTAHGRWFATSNFKYTNSHLGADVILMEAWIALPYALAPSTYTLLFLQTLAVALGAIPLYLLARRHLGPLAALGIAFAYLVYVPLHYLNLYEFQPRAFALGLVFLLFYFLDTRNLRGFVLTALALLTTRTDLALSLAMIGVFAWLHHKPRAFTFSALGLGIGWFALAAFVIVPHFNSSGKLQYLEWYSWLGNSPGAMLTTLVTRPLYIIQNVITLPKLNFLFQIFGEVAFLPLLRPDILFVGLPTFALSLLSLQRIQWDIHYQYGSFLYALSFVGTVYAIALLAQWKWLTARISSQSIIGSLVGLVVVCSLSAQLWIGSPVWSWLKRNVPESAQAANALINQVPSDAPLAASNLIGPHVSRREGLYFFPPRNEFYTDQALNRAQYVLVDTGTDRGDPTFAQLKKSTNWQLIAQQDRFMLYRRVP